MSYTVETRYEHLVREGKVFCNWFSTGAEFSSESEAKEFIKDYKKKSVNPKMNRKEEFRIVEK